MPLSSMFLNNFVILSHLFSYNIRSGILIMLSIVLVAGTLLQELYVGSVTVDDIIQRLDAAFQSANKLN